MATVSETLNQAAVAEAAVDQGVLKVTFLDGRHAAIALAELPFGSPSASAARASLDGAFVTLDGPDGSFDVTAHELSALAAGRSLARPDLAARVGANIRALRNERGLSLREFARQSGIAAPNLSNFENGHVSPRLETLGRLAEVLETSVADLVTVEPAAVATRHGAGISALARRALGIRQGQGNREDRDDREEKPRAVTG